ncbi:hypothetical protein IFM89_024656 [Coptis chinensis]|uniref:Uncharacterized protein n=1 Tax=Coptis chinensis TaxID=261450 RepID=A0A835IFP8_9MAGN|nr:hypothetical protein IFM89_024656 [Coptis chinensis]
MGFPVGYTELFLPKLLLHALSLLGYVRKLISWLFQALGLGDFLESDIAWSDSSSSFSSTTYGNNSHVSEFHSVSAVLIREFLPVVKYQDLDCCDTLIPDSCAVCLYEFEGKEEIRRTPFIPDDMQESFNERLWAASAVPDYYN